MQPGTRAAANFLEGARVTSSGTLLPFLSLAIIAAIPRRLPLAPVPLLALIIVAPGFAAAIAAPFPPDLHLASPRRSTGFCLAIREIEADADDNTDRPRDHMPLARRQDLLGCQRDADTVTAADSTT